MCVAAGPGRQGRSRDHAPPLAIPVHLTENAPQWLPGAGVKEFLQAVHQYVAAHTGPWGGRILALAAVVLGYTLIWSVLGLWRGYLVRVSRPPAGSSRVAVAISGFLGCAVATAALVWLLLGVADAFPEWLGL